MSETWKKANLDALLRQWPDEEKSSKTVMEREAGVRSVLERLAAGDRGDPTFMTLDVDLCSVPSGQTDEEGHNSAVPSRGASLAPSSGPPSEPDKLLEGTSMTMPTDRERDRKSLQELARLAQLTPPPSSVAAPSSLRPSEAGADDSGIVDLAAVSVADPQAALRAQTTPLASSSLFDDVVQGGAAHAPVSYPPPASQAPIAQVPISQAPLSYAPVAQAPVAQGLATAQPAPTLAPPAPARIIPALATNSYEAMLLPKRPRKTVVGLAVVAALAVAAGGIFMATRSGKSPEPVVATTRVEAPKAVEKTDDIPPPEPAKVAETPAEEPKVLELSADEGSGAMDPNALPAAEAVTGGRKAAATAKGADKSTAKVAASTAPATKAGAKGQDGKLTQNDLAPAAPAGPVGALGDEMRKAVGENSATTEQTPAAGGSGPQFAAGSVPQKPSQGAVTSAISAVLPQARACVGPDDAISRASIVFESAGTVQSVKVTGGAAGKEAEGCIKTAFSKAKVTPFAQPTYTANITVRP